MDEVKYNGWRPVTFSVPKLTKEDREIPYPATKFFDQLAFIGTPAVCCFLLETSAGLVLLDCMNPGQHYIDIIEQGIKDLGHFPEELNAIMITHGHGDHWGEAGYFKKKYGCKVYMNEIDYDFATHVPEQFPWKSLDYTMDGYLRDMEHYTFGNTVITVVHTPGHTPGSMSFLVPVTDEGRPHMLSIWGGAGVQAPSANVTEYLESVEKYKSVCRDFHVDCSVQTHPFIDNGILKLEIVRNIVRGVPNPFIIGEDGNEYFMDAMRASALNKRCQEKKE